MSLQYITVPDKDFGAGMDQFSPENQIKQGFTERLLNIDPLPEGQLKSRAGHQGYCGFLPVRVTSLTYHTGSGFNIELTLDGSIELSNLTSQPLVVYGRTSVNTSSNGGDFGITPSGHWYSAFLSNPRVSLSGTGTVSFPNSDHQLNTSNAFIGTVISNSTSDRSNEIFFPDSTTINKSTYEILIGYTAPVPTDIFIYTAKKDPIAGEIYVDNSQSLTSAGLTYSILAATHNLDNFNIIPKTYIDTGTVLEEILPDTVTLSSSGTVTFTFAAGRVASSTPLRLILSSVPTANAKDGTAAPLSSVTVTIPSISQPFAFVGCYLETPALSGNFELVLPDTIIYDEPAQTLSITFQNTSSSAANFRVYYEFGAVTANRLKVQGSVLSGAEYTDSAPELTIWGLNHANLYGMTRTQHEGWVNHIDGYKTSGLERLVSGLGGNLFDARTRAEVGTAYLLPELFPNIRTRLSTTVNLAPVFVSSSEVMANWRTDGYVSGDNIRESWAVVTDAQYNAGDGNTYYTLSITNKTVVGTLSSILTSPHQLTVKGLGYSRLNGTFDIVGLISEAASTIVLSVQNPSIDSADWNVSGSSGLAGVFTDHFISISDSPFILGDILQADSIPITEFITVLAGSGVNTYLSGITTRTSLGQGVRLQAKRTAYTIPLRTSTGVDSVENLVDGDMLSVTDLVRQLRVVSINPVADQDITISSDGITATVTLGGSITSSVNDTFRFEVGQRLTIKQSQTFSGEVVITSIPSSTTFTFASIEIIGSEPGVLAGYTIEIDEAFEFEDTSDNSIALDVMCRWIPIEAPDTDDNLPAHTHINYFDANVYEDQPILRSTTVADNLYLTNRQDEVFKYDGSNIYRSGFPRWQTGLFLSRVDIGTGGLGSDRLSTYSARSTTDRTITVPNAALYVAGTRYEVVSAGTSPYFIVTVTAIDTTSNLITVAEDISGIAATGTGTGEGLYQLLAYSYYFRLNAIDANQNIIASAPVGSANDFVIEIGRLSNVQIKLIGFPAFDNYDYERIEVEEYRTVGSGVVSGNYSKIVSLPLNFDNSNGYLVFTDSTPDDYLTVSSNPDIVNAGLLGAELGTGWDQPMRAKYVTSADNRLILANLKDYPQLDIVLRKTTSTDILESDLNATRWLYRKDNTDSATDTNMVGRAAYEWIDDSGAVALSSIGAISNSATAAGTVNAGTNIVTSDTAHGFQSNNRIQFTATGGSSVSLTQVYYVEVLSFTTFKLKLTKDGDFVDITTSNTIAATFEQKDAILATFGSVQTHAAKDWIYLYHDSTTVLGTANETYAGWFQAIESTVASATLKINAWNSGNFPNAPNAAISATLPADVPVLISGDYNYGMLNSGNGINVIPVIAVATRHMANAINATMRQTDVLLSGQETFTPWLVSDAGNEFTLGEWIVRQPATFDTTFELVLPSFTTFSVYIDGLNRASSSQISASSNLYPSRVLLSYQNYPELFDSPRAALPQDSDSVVDINSADGQEITGVIPFFGEAAFGAAQKSGVVVVFKTNSVYLLDVNSKQIQKVDSRGEGCTAPLSIAQTKDGLIFANQNGIHRLSFDLTVDFVGKYIDRIWKEETNTEELAIFCGHHSPHSKTYKLSIVKGSGSEPTNTLSYNYIREQYSNLRLGSWTEYDGFSTIGWANLTTDEYFAAPIGQVFVTRRANDASDDREDASIISKYILLRSNNFGDEAIRKALISISAQYRNRVDIDGTTMSIATELQDSFEEIDSFDLLYPTTSDGLSDLGKFKIISLRHSTGRRKFVNLQVKYENSSLNEPFELCGLDFRISGLQQFGTTQAADTKK